MTDRLSDEELARLIVGDVALSSDESADVALLGHLLASPAVWAEPSASLEDAVVREVLNAEAPARSLHSVTTPARRQRRQRRRVSVRVAGAATAAAAAIALVIGLALPNSEPGAAFKGQLTATALGRGARAEMKMYDTPAGFRVELDAHGLPELPPGEYYQAWVRNATGTVAAIGTFSSSDGEVALWSGVSPKDFPTVTVTIESTDNQPAPSGRRVLSGVMHAA